MSKTLKLKTSRGKGKITYGDVPTTISGNWDQSGDGNLYFSRVEKNGGFGTIPNDTTPDLTLSLLSGNSGITNLNSVSDDIWILVEYTI